MGARRGQGLQDPDVVAAALAHCLEKPAIGFSDCLVLEVARQVTCRQAPSTATSPGSMVPNGWLGEEGEVSRSGKRLKSMVVETSERALVDAVKGIAGDVFGRARGWARSARRRWWRSTRLPSSRVCGLGRSLMTQDVDS